MNYRHAFHAGNHGDVLKHVVLTRVMAYLIAKETPLAVLDAHAGIGRYDLTGVEALKTGEWRGGIGAFLKAELENDVGELLRPYIQIVRTMNPFGTLQHYPGSPELLTRLARANDRILLNELHPQDNATLSIRYARLPNVKVSCVDATQAVKAALPFPERRGLVLIDPAFEVTNETQKIAALLKQGLQRMAQTCFVIWYPVTTQEFADNFCGSLLCKGAKSVLRAELLVRPAIPENGLAGSGVVVVNPPWVLYNELQILLPALASALGEGQGGRSTLQWLVEPT